MPHKLRILILSIVFIVTGCGGGGGNSPSNSGNSSNSSNSGNPTDPSNPTDSTTPGTTPGTVPPAGGGGGVGGGGAPPPGGTVLRSQVPFGTPVAAGSAFNPYAGSSQAAIVSENYMIQSSNGGQDMIVAGRMTQPATAGTWQNSMIQLYNWQSGVLTNDTAKWFPGGINNILGTDPTVQFADFFKSGRTDMFVAPSTDMAYYGPASLFINNGNSFSKTSIPLNNVWGHGAAVGSLRRDGWLDVAISDYGPNTTLLFNNKSNNFTPYTEVNDATGAKTLRWGGSGIAIGDFMGDGSSYLILTDNTCQDTSTGCSDSTDTHMYSWNLSNRNGSIGSKSTLGTVTTTTTSTVATPVSPAPVLGTKVTTTTVPLVNGSLTPANTVVTTVVTTSATTTTTIATTGPKWGLGQPSPDTLAGNDLKLTLGFVKNLPAAPLAHTILVLNYDFAGNGRDNLIVFSTLSNPTASQKKSAIQFLLNNGSGNFTDATSDFLIGYNTATNISYKPQFVDLGNGQQSIIVSSTDWDGTNSSTQILVKQSATGPYTAAFQDIMNDFETQTNTVSGIKNNSGNATGLIKNPSGNLFLVSTTQTGYLNAKNMQQVFLAPLGPQATTANAQSALHRSSPTWPYMTSTSANPALSLTTAKY